MLLVVYMFFITMISQIIHHTIFDLLNNLIANSRRSVLHNGNDVYT